jgi:dephospho-CoA kinase
MERNNISMEEAKARVYSQISIDKKRRMADHEIDNRDSSNFVSRLSISWSAILRFLSIEI